MKTSHSLKSLSIDVKLLELGVGHFSYGLAAAVSKSVVKYMYV